MKFLKQFIISIALLLNLNNLSLAETETVGEIMEELKPITIRDSFGTIHKGYRCHFKDKNKLIKGGFVGIDTTVAGYRDGNKFISQAVISRDSYVLDESHVESGALITGKSAIRGSSEVEETVRIDHGHVVNSKIAYKADVSYAYLESATIEGLEESEKGVQIIGSIVSKSEIKDEAYIYNSKINDSTICGNTLVLNQNLCNSSSSEGSLSREVRTQDELIKIPEIKFSRLVRKKVRKLPIANLEMLSKQSETF